MSTARPVTLGSKEGRLRGATRVPARPCRRRCRTRGRRRACSAARVSIRGQTPSERPVMHAPPPASQARLTHHMSRGAWRARRWRTYMAMNCTRGLACRAAQAPRKCALPSAPWRGSTTPTRAATQRTSRLCARRSRCARAPCVARRCAHHGAAWWCLVHTFSCFSTPCTCAQVLSDPASRAAYDELASQLKYRRVTRACVML